MWERSLLLHLISGITFLCFCVSVILHPFSKSQLTNSFLHCLFLFIYLSSYYYILFHSNCTIVFNSVTCYGAVRANVQPGPYLTPTSVRAKLYMQTHDGKLTRLCMWKRSHEFCRFRWQHLYTCSVWLFNRHIHATVCTEVGTWKVQPLSWPSLKLHAHKELEPFKKARECLCTCTNRNKSCACF